MSIKCTDTEVEMEKEEVFYSLEEDHNQSKCKPSNSNQSFHGDVNSNKINSNLKIIIQDYLNMTVVWSFLLQKYVASISRQYTGSINRSLTGRIRDQT